jgi:hypothetical protein
VPNSNENLSGIVLSAAAEVEKSCRRCLSHLAFDAGSYDLEVEAEEGGFRVSILQVLEIVRDLGLSKEALLQQKNKGEIITAFTLARPQLKESFERSIDDGINSLRFIDNRNPNLALLVSNQGYIGYLIGITARLMKRSAQEIIQELSLAVVMRQG